MSLQLDTSFPLHCLAQGPITYESIPIATQDLDGSYLLFAYIQATETEGRAVIDFGPDRKPSGVRFGKDGSLRSYEPVKSREDMIAVIKNSLDSTTVWMPKPVRQ